MDIKFWLVNLNGKVHVEESDVNGRIILKWTLDK
jgi:hypothetical protein